jgi:dolichol-phosphate mannosyltransferase
VNLEGIRSKGFASLYEVNYVCHRSGKAFREVPIKFVERRAGASKLSWKVIAEALIVLLRLRFKGG